MSEVKIEKRGGARKGAGAKKKADRKIAVPCFILTSIVNSHGGKEGMRNFIYNKVGQA